MSDNPALFDPPDHEDRVRPVPHNYLEPLTDSPRLELPDPDAVGRTMFDTPGAEDGSVTVLLPKWVTP